MAAVQKQEIFRDTEKELANEGFTIMSRDEERPWGGFFVLDESQAEKFATRYFAGIGMDKLRITGKLSPKFLLVAPSMRLSWQYHHRRAEIWKVVHGVVGVMTSDTDIQTTVVEHKTGDLIVIKQGERHRLVGLSEWGIVAEIWQHTNASNPSNEDDIVRVQDDFGR